MDAEPALQAAPPQVRPDVEATRKKSVKDNEDQQVNDDLEGRIEGGPKQRQLVS